MIHNNDFDSYQDFTSTVAIYDPKIAVPYTACGLSGESGEYAGKIRAYLQRVLENLPTDTTHRDNLVEVAKVLADVEEVGKRAEKIKKLLRKGEMLLPTLPDLTEEENEAASFELGDSGWYFAQGAKALRKKLSDIVNRNVKKLTSRKERSVLEGSGDNR